MEALDVDVGHDGSELGAERRSLEVGGGRECGLGIGPDGEHEPSTVGVATERAAHEAGLLVGELHLDTLIELPERRLVDPWGQPKRQDLEHDLDATVR